MTTVIPPHLLKSSEWMAALLILSNTSIKEFFTTAYVDLQKEQIDFRKMRRACSTNSSKCLVDVAAHLFNVWQYPKFPGNEIFNLDYDNKCYVFVAMMIRHGVHPKDVLNEYKLATGQREAL